MADGKPFMLGRQNVAETVSALVKRGVGPALRLLVDSGPPLEVNSQEKVVNLNADKLDGKDAEAFLAVNGKAQNAAHADRADTAANADTLDGKDSSEFYPAGSKVGDSTHADWTDWAADAQTLDGRYPYEFTTGVAELRFSAVDDPLPDNPDTPTIWSLSVIVPAPGYLRLNGNVTFTHDLSNVIPPTAGGLKGSGMVQGVLRMLSTYGPSSETARSCEDLKGREYANLALDGVFRVGPGNHTVDVLLIRGNAGVGVGPIYMYDGVLTAEYSYYNLSGEEE